ncbi:MAG: manganese efflux pump MntP family protein [Pseudomonadota bacterium]
MDTVTLLGISLALGMDALAVSAAVAAGLSDVTGRHMFRLSWHFGLFQGLMTILGAGVGAGLAGFLSKAGHWIAFSLLAFMGAKMIYESRNPESRTEDYDPSRGWSLVALSVAVSIDALAVGFSLRLLGISAWHPALVIGLFALVMAFAGARLGKRAGGLVGCWAERVGGLVLMAIGLRILLEHLIP